MTITYSNFPKSSFAETFYSAKNEQEATEKGATFWRHLEASGHRIQSMRIGMTDAIAKISK